MNADNSPNSGDIVEDQPKQPIKASKAMKGAKKPLASNDNIQFEQSDSVSAESSEG